MRLLKNFDFSKSLTVKGTRNEIFTVIVKMSITFLNDNESS